ncbi:LacI family DNA-binding transcriptional regulator [Streptomyces sp. NPDC097610]|uniref:LacI family DNA-binding transcriptional regulator n=1 Tax=Streptomyces sp. NPDC097610 TaxID=3157227 RepID=UPI0033286998
MTVGARHVTMSDVATASGVSRATVSFVLNNDPNQTIPPTTSERVRQAARDLGYIPHGIAGNYSRSCIRGLDDELAAHDHVLLVRHDHGAPHSTQQVLDVIAPRAVLGFAANAALQIRHLADRGHTHFATGLPDHDSPLLEVRPRPARETVNTLEVAPLTSFVVPRPRTAGTVAVRTFLAAHGTVTTVAAFDDDIALRTLTALHDRDLPYPATWPRSAATTRNTAPSAHPR